MTPQSQRIAIAEACGWTKEEPFLNAAGTTSQFWTIGDPHSSEYQQCFQSELPNYLHDLNAIAEAEMRFSQSSHEAASYLDNLVEACRKEEPDPPTNASACFILVTATAAQRSEAFLRTLGLWKSS